LTSLLFLSFKIASSFFFLELSEEAISDPEFCSFSSGFEESVFLVSST